MHPDNQLVSDFYKSFQQLDPIGMNSCYAQHIVFYDPVFGLLEGDQVRAMWTMLCRNAKDFKLDYGNISDIGDGYHLCDWTASYTFSKTGRKVINKVRANMRIENGKIIEHSDAFSLHTWSKQALGFGGWLLGWNRFYQQAIKNKARRQLLAFMENNVID